MRHARHAIPFRSVQISTTRQAAKWQGEKGSLQCNENKSEEKEKSFYRVCMIVHAPFLSTNS